MDENYTLRTGRTAAAVMEAADLDGDSAALLEQAVDPRDFVERLVAGELAAEAVAFLAHALPRREAIWWALLCAREAADGTPEVAAALEAVRAWIAEPNDTNRRNAFAHAEHVGLGTPCGLAGAAVFMSGDSLAPPGGPVIPPAPDDGSRAIAGAVMLAAVDSQPGDVSGALHGFITQGLALAERTQLWSPAGDGS